MSLDLKHWNKYWTMIMLIVLVGSGAIIMFMILSPNSLTRTTLSLIPTDFNIEGKSNWMTLEDFGWHPEENDGYDLSAYSTASGFPAMRISPRGQVVNATWALTAPTAYIDLAFNLVFMTTYGSAGDGSRIGFQFLSAGKVVTSIYYEYNYLKFVGPDGMVRDVNQLYRTTGNSTGDHVHVTLSANTWTVNAIAGMAMHNGTSSAAGNLAMIDAIRVIGLSTNSIGVLPILDLTT